MCVCGGGGVLINILVLQLGPPKQKFLTLPLTILECSHVFKHRLQTSMAKIQMHIDHKAVNLIRSLLYYKLVTLIK